MTPGGRGPLTAFEVQRVVCCRARRLVAAEMEVVEAADRETGGCLTEGLVSVGGDAELGEAVVPEMGEERAACANDKGNDLDGPPCLRVCPEGLNQSLVLAVFPGRCRPKPVRGSVADAGVF